MNRSVTKLPVTVITGFLGSGKTTLIRHLMQNPNGKRLAVIVNEFGDVGVDGEILKSCAIPNCPAENIVELSNGCICCTVADDFIPTIETLMTLEATPDHILIETSGLALPKPLLKAFEWPDIRSKITVDGVIALADAEAVAAGRFAPNIAAVEAQRQADESLDHETPLSEVFEDQICCADIVLLTKADLAGKEGVSNARKVILGELPRSVPIVEVTEGEVDQRIVLGLGAAAEDDLNQRPSHHDNIPDHDHEDFDSIVVELGEFYSVDDIVERISKVAKSHNILRIKGYVSIKNKPMRLLVQGVGLRIRTQFDRLWNPEESRVGKLVLIAEHDNINQTEIEKTIKCNPNQCI